MAKHPTSELYEFTQIEFNLWSVHDIGPRASRNIYDINAEN